MTRLLLIFILAINCEILLNKISYSLYQTDTIVADISLPYGIAVDPATGDVFVTNNCSSACVISKFVPGIGTATLTTFAGAAEGKTDGAGTYSSFSNEIGHITFCSYDGNFYIADYGNHLIRRMTTNAVVSTVAGGATSGSTDGIGTFSYLDSPTTMSCRNSDGNLLIADDGNYVLRMMTFSSMAVNLFAGEIGTSGDTDGTGTFARFYNVYGSAYNPSNNCFYVSGISSYDYPLIRKITLLGEVTTLLNQNFNSPNGIAYNPLSGDIVVADSEAIKVFNCSYALISIIAVMAGNANGIGTFSEVMNLKL